VFAGLGVVPDADLLVPGTHRIYSHSIAAAGLVGLLALISLTAAGTRAAHRGDRVTLAFAAAAAYGSHVLLDWMGNDGSPPLGICALWPFSNAFYESDLHLFPPVERRYWLPIFWSRNALALSRELLVMLPLAVLAVIVRRRTTPSSQA
jgi:membrane-bound metal-dependent hydrolase YbcI (DUF457 family)